MDPPISLRRLERYGSSSASRTAEVFSGDRRGDSPPAHDTVARLPAVLVTRLTGRRRGLNEARPLGGFAEKGSLRTLSLSYKQYPGCAEQEC